MRRRLFTVVSVLSLVLCAALIALWVRSHFVDDGFIVARPRFAAMGRVNRGTLCVMVLNMQSRSTSLRYLRWNGMLGWDEFPIAPYAYGPGPLKNHVRLLGFRLDSGEQAYVFGKPPNTIWKEVPFLLWTIPLWLPCALTFIPALALLPRLRRTRPAGHCRKCGYDLRASKDRCPECGTLILMTEATA